MSDLNKLALLISKPENFEYFFKRLEKPDLFDWLNDEMHSFDYIPELELSEDGQYIHFNPWWPGKYLVKVADKIPAKVFSVLQKVKTDNRTALDDCAKAILNMPIDFLNKNSNEVVALFDKWLNSKCFGFIHDRAIDLLGKYLEGGHFESACKLLEILSKTKISKRGEPEFRFDSHYYEKIIKSYFSKLIEYKSSMVLSIIETKLKETIGIELRGDERRDGSIGWRPAIEDHDQNWGFDDPKDIFSAIIRDALNKKCQVDSAEALQTIKRYLLEDFSIFKRLAIHTIRINNFDDLAKDILCNKDNLDDADIHHEFFELLGSKFGILEIQQKKLFIKRILEINPEEIITDQSEDIIKRYVRRWQADRLFMIKKYIESEPNLAEFKYILDEYREDFNNVNHPTFLSFHTAWSGPTSALTKEDIVKMSPMDFIDWIKNNLQPPYEMMGPSPEGVARIFQDVVKENPQPYALVAEKFLDDRIWPAYLSGFMQGLENAIKEGRIFELEPVLKFIENPLKFLLEPEVKTRHDEFDLGQYSWLRGTIANFIEELVKKNEYHLSTADMDKTHHVLIDLIEKDSDPSEESEKQYGPEAQNKDYVNFCINSNRGKAMQALIQHAMRRARMRPEEERKKEEGKGPFPPGRRMDLYRDFFSKRLTEEKSPSVQSSYGYFFPYLFYLDQEWIREMITKGKLFPKVPEKERFWEAHWYGYISFNKFSNELYCLLKENYKRAVGQINYGTDSKNHHQKDNRLTEHLMIAYWGKLEDLNDSDGLLNLFFKNASSDLRGHAVWFLGTAIERVKPSFDSEEWGRLKALWEHRIKKVNDTELASFAKWLKYCPDNLDSIVNLIKPIIPYLYKGYQEEDLLEYIDDKIETSTKGALDLLNELFLVKESLINIHFRLELIKGILLKARKYKDDQAVASGINQVINRLGEAGYYDFRDLLVQ